ncbi:MAG: hypothetical protein PVF49_13450, partial [Anaerolineales bacterium]
MTIARSKTFARNALIIVALVAASTAAPTAQATGPLELYSPDSTSYARLLFVGQYLLTWRDIQEDNLSSDATIEFRRIRLGARATFREENLKLYL